MRRPVVILASAAALVGSAPARAATVPVIVIDGKGHGHGVGMAQDGALWMGKRGSTTAQILSQFYPGTTLGRGGGEVRVGVLTSPANSAVVRFPNGGELRDAREGSQSAGFPVRVAAGGQARLRFDGRQFVVEVAGASLAAATVHDGNPPVAARTPGVVAASAGPETGELASTGPETGVLPRAGDAVARQEAAPTTAPATTATTAPATTTATTAPPTTAPTSTATTAPSTTAPATTATTAPGLIVLPPGKPLVPLPTGTLLPMPSVPLPTTTTDPPAPPVPPAPGSGHSASSARPLWAVPSGGGTVEVPERGARYRGVVQAVGGGPLRLVNHVDVEQYLRGMGEVRNPSWPAASLRAQAIAARTYAMRAVAGGGELCDTQQCQVYLGAQVEYAAMDKAVSATRGQVLMYRKALISAVYSANGGGFSASTEEGFGTPGAGYPYLRPAPYPTGDPGTWSVIVSLRDLAARVGYRGKVTGVHPQTGPSGRVVQVALDGSSGARLVRGIDFERALGLRSTMFAVRLAESATAPPPPPTDGGAIQGLPGDPTAVPGEVTAAAAPASAALARGGAVAPVTAAAVSAPTAASRTALGALAWVLLMCASSAIAATLVSRPRRSAR